MRTAILCFTLFLCINVKAQDIITVKDGGDLRAKVVEVTPNEIKYKRKGEILTMKKSDVIMIKYKGGRMEYFTEQPKEQKENSGTAQADTILHGSDSMMAEQGKADAKRYYVKYKSAASWTTTVTFLTSPVIGLVPAIVCSTSPPSNKNLNCPHPDLLRTPAYGNAYYEQARKIKAGKTWIGYGVGTAIFAVLVAFTKIVIKS
jgi:hypothetical protein